MAVRTNLVSQSGFPLLGVVGKMVGTGRCAWPLSSGTKPAGKVKEKPSTPFGEKSNALTDQTLHDCWQCFKNPGLATISGSSALSAQPQVAGLPGSARVVRQKVEGWHRPLAGRLNSSSWPEK